MRIILFTGKGGVGKTTIAAATAIQCSKEGKKTLIISTDPAHSLSDTFEVEIGPEPKQLQNNLWGQELDVYYSIQKYWGNLRELMLTVFRWQGVKDVLAEEMSAIPGMEEGAAFMWIEKYYSEKQFDVIIIDSAPTGETLTLLTLPQVTKWWVTKAFPLQKFAIRSVGRLVRGATGIPLDKGYNELNNLFDKLEKIHSIFADPDICSVRLVTTPERMVINESKRAYTYLQLYGYNVDAVIINRTWNTDSENSFVQNLAKQQEKYIEEIKTSFEQLPIFGVMHQTEEVFGKEKLTTLAEKLYNKPASEIFYNDKPYTIEKTKKGYRLQIKLPFLENKTYKLKKFGDELVLQIGNQKRNIFLPRFAKLMQIHNEEYDLPFLTIELTK